MTDRPNQDATNTLKSLVRQGPAHDFPLGRNPTATPNGVQARSGSDIKSLLRGQPAADTDSRWPHPGAVAPQTPAAAAAPDLRTLLRSPEKQPAFRQNENQNAPQAPVADIKALVGGFQSSANTALPGAFKAAALQSANPTLTSLAHAGSDRGRQTGSEPDSPITRFKVPQLLIAVAVIVMAVAGVVTWRSSIQPVVTTAAKSLQEQVLDLSNGVTAYRKTHGILPESLHELPEFPENALDLPGAYYGGTLLDDRAEFFLTRLPGERFSIVGRYRDEAWAYVDGAQEAIPVRAH